jgi:hypothetical protein
LPHWHGRSEIIFRQVAPGRVADVQNKHVALLHAKQNSVLVAMAAEVQLQEIEW